MDSVLAVRMEGDMDVVTVTCETCGVLTSADYAANQDHEASGLCAGVAGVHVAEHPDHVLTYRRETAEQAAARHASEAEAERVRHSQEIEAERRQRIERAGVRFAALDPYQQRRILRGQ